MSYKGFAIIGIWFAIGVGFYVHFDPSVMGLAVFFGAMSTIITALGLP